MKLIIHTISGTIEVEPAVSINMDSIIEQLEQGNMVLIETKNNSTIILNCINITAIEII